MADFTCPNCDFECTGEDGTDSFRAGQDSVLALLREPETIEVVAKAIHDHWQNGHRSWEETCVKLPGQARDFRYKAQGALAALEARLKGGDG